MLKVHLNWIEFNWNEMNSIKLLRTVLLMYSTGGIEDKLYKYTHTYVSRTVSTVQYSTF